MSEQEETNAVRERAARARGIDATDRRILAALARRADVSYAELAKIVALSPPAVHERVKRLRAAGVIKRTVAILDAKFVDKPMLAFVSVETVGWGKTEGLMALADLPEVEDIHTVTGDACLLLKVRVSSSDALEGLLARLYETPGVRATRTTVVLSTYLERTTQADVTAALAIP